MTEERRALLDTQAFIWTDRPPPSSLIPHHSPPILVLGGTFDPPHIAHLLLAQCALHQFGGRLLLMPAGDPWRKRTGAVGEQRAITPAHHRLAMTRLAAAGEPDVEVDDREVRREGPSYTVDTLEELAAEQRASAPGLVLILGGDALADLPNWKNPGRIRELATIAIAPKVGDSSLGTRDPGLGTPISSMPLLPISSTLIRQRVALGLPIARLVPAAVERYIHEHGLYRDAR